MPFIGATFVNNDPSAPADANLHLFPPGTPAPPEVWIGVGGLPPNGRTAAPWGLRPPHDIYDTIDDIGSTFRVGTTQLRMAAPIQDSGWEVQDALVTLGPGGTGTVSATLVNSTGAVKPVAVPLI